MAVSAIRFGHSEAHAQQHAQPVRPAFRQRARDVFTVQKKPRTALNIINDPAAGRGKKFMARLIDMYHRQHWWTWIQQKTGIGSCGYVKLDVPCKLSKSLGHEHALSCSNVMLEAIQKNGAFKGFFQGLTRLAKCNPVTMLLHLAKRRI